MQRFERFKEAYSLPALATYGGTAASVWAISSDYLLTGVIVLTLLCVILMLSNILMYRRYSYFKRYKKVDADLRRLTHRIHDFLLELRIGNGSSDFEMSAAMATKGALTAGSNIFSTLLGIPCTASLMLQRNGRLVTSLYCHNVDISRESNPSQGLDPNQGVASEAFITRDAVVWSAEEKLFKEIRQNSKKFYLSGISVPFKVGQHFVGLLNIDCRQYQRFDVESHRELALSIADTIASINEALALCQDTQ